MKTFINRWLAPPFLKRWDAYLLVHYPMLWYSRAIWVLFYGLIAAPLLFAAGFFYPIDAQHLTVDPIRPIEMARDAYYLYTILFLSFGLLYWAFRQYQTGFPFSQAKEVLLTLCLYALCLWVLLGITAPAFRMGTIYKTAYHWMTDEDLKTLEESGIYPYGFVLLEGDTAFTTPPADTFFQRREEILKAIVRVEDTLLQNNYQTDTTFWEQQFYIPSSHLSHLSHISNWPDSFYVSNWVHLWNWSDPSNWSYRSYWSYLPNWSYLSYLSYQLNWSNWSYLSDWSYRSYLSDWSYLSYLSNWSYQSYRSYRSYRLHLSYRSYRSDLLDRSYLLDWNAAYWQYKNAPLLFPNFGDYRFAQTIDSTLISATNGDSIWFERPTLPYSVEDAVRSVKHARLYWEEGIYFRHLFHLRHYVLLAALVLLGLPLLRLKNGAIVVVVVAVTLISTTAAGFYNLEKNYTTYWGAIQYLVLPALALGGLGISVVKKKYYSTTLFFFTLAVINLLIPLIVIEYGSYSSKISYYYPSNFAFYSLQALALVAALLMPYVRALPKVD